jgi:BCD family chlorophyll transporter-like MFS transporter
MSREPLGWFGIFRLGLVQTALGAIVVLTTSTLNRVMVVELAFPALLPGLLVGLHYAVQILRPRMGFGSDVGGRRTPWIIGGMCVLAGGGILAALATAWMETAPVAGIALAVVAFLAIGGGVSAAGTTLLVLLAKRTAEHQRAAAATIVWLMMIAGFALTAITAGQYLDPYSPSRLVGVTSAVALAAVLLTVVALAGIEGPVQTPSAERGSGAAAPESFRDALLDVWSEPQARKFTIFIFISMLAYSAQDLILEPFAGSIFAYTPGQSTKLAGLQHGGVFAGMVLVGVAASIIGGPLLGSLRLWIVGGCLASAVSLMSLVMAGVVGPAWPLRTSVVALGVANGAFAIAAIGSMMNFASQGRAGREGVRMGLWGAAQGIAFGLGGLAGAIASDIARMVIGSRALAYATVFALEACLFVVAAGIAMNLGRALGERHAPATGRLTVDSVGIGLMPEAGKG